MQPFQFAYTNPGLGHVTRKVPGSPTFLKIDRWRLRDVDDPSIETKT